MQSTKVILGLAVMSVATVSQASVVWNSDVDNADWGADANWSTVAVPGASDDVELNTNATTNSRTIRLNGDRAVNSLSAINYESTNHAFTLQPGTPSTSSLTLLSGNITVDAGAPASSAAWVPLKMSTLPLVIGDGVTPVTDAEWNLKTTGFSGTTRGTVRLELGEIRGIAGTVATIKNLQNTSVSNQGVGNNLTFYASSNDFLGKIVVDAGFRFSIYSKTNNGLGNGTVELLHETAFNFETIDQTENANFIFGHTSGTTTFAPDIGNFGFPARGSVTLNGDFSGQGNVTFGKRFDTSTAFYNTAIHNGDSSLSGNVKVEAGTLRVNGTWSGTGDVLVYAQYTGNYFRDNNIPGRLSLEGVGTLGLGSGKTITMRGNTHNTVGSDAAIAPGTIGTVGTLTVGTDASNSVIFLERTQLLIDVDGASADRLVVNGSWNLNNASDALLINVLGTPTEAQYVLASWTGALGGTFDGVSGIPAGYELQYTSNQLLLVNPSIPEPTAIAGLALLGGMLVRRRRSH